MARGDDDLQRRQAGPAPRYRGLPAVLLTVLGAGTLAAGLLGGYGVLGHRTAETAPTTTAPTTAVAAPSTTTTQPVTTTTRPSAAGDLAGYFASALAIDQKLRAAATAIDAGIAADRLTLTVAARDAIAAADPTAAPRAIPAGLDPGLLLKVLMVQSDLVSRFYALHGYEMPFTPATQTVTIPRTDANAGYALDCLGNGTEAAGAFRADLAAARTAAAATPPVTAASADSRAAADLAIWLADLNLRNSGCASCGGQRVTGLGLITWHEIGPKFPSDLDWNGDIAGVPFFARFVPGQGWLVTLEAC